MTIKEIKEDLLNIRLYYLDQDFYKRWSSKGISNVVEDTVAKYTQLMKNAPVGIFRIYIGLYVEGMTQEAYAENSGYSVKNVYYWNHQLLQYLQKAMC